MTKSNTDIYSIYHTKKYKCMSPFSCTLNTSCKHCIYGFWLMLLIWVIFHLKVTRKSFLWNRDYMQTCARLMKTCNIDCWKHLSVAIMKNRTETRNLLHWFFVLNDLEKGHSFHAMTFTMIAQIGIVSWIDLYFVH